ncbi:MAG: hypothetical protein ACI9F9_000840, partial [Candidatus Paceibacteria bacterium]
PLVHLDVQSGRAMLVTNHGVQPISAQRGVTPFHGAGHLEVAPGSKASVRWQGAGSVSLVGPASVAWQAPEGSGTVRLEFSSIGTADIEVRSTPMRVDLPGAWRLQLNSGAYSVYCMGGGGVELVHRAGHPARASWIGGGRLAPPPVVVQAGERYLLKGAPEFIPRPDLTHAAPGWTDSVWPWGQGKIEGAPDIVLAGAPAWKQKQWPWGAEELDVEPWTHWDWPWSSAESMQQDAAQVDQGMVPQPTPAEELHAPSSAGAAPQTEPLDQRTPSTPDPIQGVSSTSAARTPRATGNSLSHVSTEQIRPTGPVTPALESGLLEDELPGTTLAPNGIRPDSPAKARTDAPDLVANETPSLESPSTTQPPSVQDEASEPQASPWDTSIWRGLAEDQVENHGAFLIQRGTDLEMDRLDGGDLRFRMPSDADAPSWYFSQRLDVRIFPGGSLVTGSDGFLRYHRGTVRILSADRERIF